MEILHPIFKWLHIIAGITWIGLLYFFNFINGHVAGTMDGDIKKKVIPELMPRALYWFRWGAAPERGPRASATPALRSAAPVAWSRCAIAA